MADENGREVKTAAQQKADAEWQKKKGGKEKEKKKKGLR